MINVYGFNYLAVDSDGTHVKSGFIITDATNPVEVEKQFRNKYKNVTATAINNSHIQKLSLNDVSVSDMTAEELMLLMCNAKGYTVVHEEPKLIDSKYIELKSYIQNEFTYKMGMNCSNACSIINDLYTKINLIDGE